MWDCAGTPCTHGGASESEKGGATEEAEVEMMLWTWWTNGKSRKVGSLGALEQWRTACSQRGTVCKLSNCRRLTPGTSRKYIYVTVALKCVIGGLLQRRWETNTPFQASFVHHLLTCIFFLFVCVSLCSVCVQGDMHREARGGCWVSCRATLPSSLGKALWMWSLAGNQQAPAILLSWLSAILGL